MHAVAAEYPHSTFSGTATCSSHIGKYTALYETHVAGQEESGCVDLDHCGLSKFRLCQAGDTRIPLPCKSVGHPQKIVDCKVGLCTSLRTVAEFL